MANSRSLIAKLSALLQQALMPHAVPSVPFTIALSGGLDSVALLHAAVALRAQHGWLIHAVHIHHGLQAAADTFAAFCVQLCEAWQVPYYQHDLALSDVVVSNVEGQARAARYAALAVYPRLVLAQHADDQAETVLLQLLRGAGVSGLAAMPVQQCYVGNGASKHVRLRPWLGVSRAEIQRYAQAVGLHWVEDPSNLDMRFERNFLRQQVLPLLKMRFPACLHTFARSAQHCAQAAELLHDLAVSDGLPLIGESLALVPWRRLSAQRQRNVLCVFLRQQATYLPHQAQIETLQQQLQRADPETHVALQWGDWEVQQFADQLYAFARLAAVPPRLDYVWQGEAQLSWLGGQLEAHWARGRGVAVAYLDQQSSIHLCLRQGGERLRLHDNRPSQRVKNLWQQEKIPPWVRARAPYVWAGEDLLAVANLGTAAAYQATAMQWGVSWYWQTTKPVVELGEYSKK